MATSGNYKNSRTRRILEQYIDYKLGCYYTNQEVPAGYAKLLVNYDYTDDGTTLRPRQGIVNDAVLYHSDLDTSATQNITLGDAHVDGLLYFEDVNGVDQLSEFIISFGQVLNFSAADKGITQDRYYCPNWDVVSSDAVFKAETGWNVMIDKRNVNKHSDKSYYIGSYNSNASAENTIGLVRTKSYDNVEVFNTGLSSFDITRPVCCNANGVIYAITTGGVSQNGDTTTSADPEFRLSRLKLKETTTDNGPSVVIYRDKVDIKTPSLTESVSIGFNMLLDSPYEFKNQAGGSAITGLIAYRPAAPSASDPLGEVLFTANTGETIRINCVYQYETGVEYEIKWEYKGGIDTDWTLLRDWTSVGAGGTDNYWYYDVIPEHESFSVYCSIRHKGDDATVRVGVLPLFQLNQDDLKNLGQDVFDLTTARGMFHYNNMLGLYGVEGAETSVFFSDIENAGYFPFPHNTDTFDEYVLKVVNYLDSLLVITTSSIYAITGGGLPSTFVRKKLITNLNITELDAELVKVIKDQVFFKADNTFFVLKPNTYTGDATDLRAYEVSKAINTFLLDFKKNTLDMYNTLYPLRLTEPELIDDQSALNQYKYNDLNILGYDQHVVDGRLQIVLRLELICNDLVNYEIERHFVNEVDLTIVYDTLTKQWSFLSNSLLNTSALRHRRIDNQRLLYFDNAITNNKRYLIIASAVDEPKDGYSYTLDDGTEISKQAKLPNWQLVQTGIIQLYTQYYKRLRELQFTINNTSQANLSFYTDVFIDGRNELSSVKYNMEHNTDPTDPDYGHIYITYEDESNVKFSGSTQLNDWMIDFGRFPDVTLLRTHLQLRGKGRFIGFNFVNRDEERYELAQTLWAFRVMNGR